MLPEGLMALANNLARFFESLIFLFDGLSLCFMLTFKEEHNIIKKQSKSSDEVRKSGNHSLIFWDYLEEALFYGKQ